MALLFSLPLFLLIAYTSAFMYLPPGETNWTNARSSMTGHIKRMDPKREQLESMSQTMTPQDLAGVYNYPSGGYGGQGQIIAVVVYGNCTYGESDLKVFSAHYGLPTCTREIACLLKVTANGDQNFPASTPEWDTECSLDLQQAHATAPGARLMIVTATDSSEAALARALIYAGQNANYVSASWGGDERAAPSVEGYLESAISTYGTSFFAASGDNGGQDFQLWPASSPNFISVGGTTVSGYGSSATETAWSKSGGGCSVTFRATNAQYGDAGYVAQNCNGFKGVPDMAYDADPDNSGISAYSSQNGGWVTFGGTSLAAPRAAGKAALYGMQVTPALVYGGLTFRDITQGSNGKHSAAVGYDLVTGKGSWLGIQQGTPTTTPHPFPTPEPGC